MPVQVANNAAGALASGISSGALSLTLSAGAGAKFPTASVASNTWFWATIFNASNVNEIVKVTDRTGDVFTITRAQDGTTASAFIAGDVVELRPTAALFNDMRAENQTHNATAKATPVDADEFGFWDSVASAWVKATWAQIKTALNAIYSTLIGIQLQSAQAFTTGGTSTAYTLTPTPAIAANATNLRFRVTFHAAAGATPTLAVSGKTALPLKYKDSAGALQTITSVQAPINFVADVESDGTNWIMLQTADTPHTGVAQSWGGVQTPATGTASISATGDFVYDPSTHGQVCTITLTNAITVTLKCSAGKIVAGTHYTLRFVAGDTSARSFAKGSTVAGPSGALPITSGTVTSGGRDVFHLVGVDTNNAEIDGSGADVR